MSSITKLNILDIMSEAAKCEVNTDVEQIEDIADDIKDTVEKCSEMTCQFNYTPEMIPVIFDESTGNYFVEYDMLQKLIESEDSISLDTKFGKIEFTPIKKEEDEDDDDDDEDEDKLKALNEEDPEDEDDDDDYDDDDDDDSKCDKKELCDDDDDYDDKIEEAYFGNYCYDNNIRNCTPCREKDALAAVILANLSKDPNREEMENKEGCCGLPEMTFENTYIVIESESDLNDYIDDICESAKKGKLGTKAGKNKLKKADAKIKNMLNNGLKVAKKKSCGKKSGCKNK